jgi:hypothetical protein
MKTHVRLRPNCVPPFAEPVGPLCVGNGTVLPYFKQNITMAGGPAEVWSATAPGSNAGGRDTFILRYPGGCVQRNTLPRMASSCCSLAKHAPQHTYAYLR